MASQNSNLSQQLAVKNEEVNELTAAQVSIFTYLCRVSPKGGHFVNSWKIWTVTKGLIVKGESEIRYQQKLKR